MNKNILRGIVTICAIFFTACENSPSISSSTLSKNTTSLATKGKTTQNPTVITVDLLAKASKTQLDDLQTRTKIEISNTLKNFPDNIIQLSKSYRNNL